MKKLDSRLRYLEERKEADQIDEIIICSATDPNICASLWRRIIDQPVPKTKAVEMGRVISPEEAEQVYNSLMDVSYEYQTK